MAKALNAQTMTAKWQQRASGAATDYKNGVNAVTSAPGAAAAAQEQAMLQHVTEAVTSGRWAKRTGAVTLESWKASAAGKGANNYPGGIQAGQTKFSQFATAFIPHLQTLQGILAGMPKVTPSDMEQRALTTIRHNRTFKTG